jgi:UDP:flavonoid glycosyltransferase YjiC (YdhE family)/glycosyltransferase involved in cell wall biosynthesis
MTSANSSGPLVSVVMSTYSEVNAPAPVGESGPMLLRAIASVIAQSYQNWELWVVSDHPLDRDREAIAKLIASFGDERVHYEDLGARAGLGTLGVRPKRRGVECSRGRLLAFLDADNAFEREHLSRCVQAFSDNGDALDLVYCDTRVIFGGTLVEGEEDPGGEVISFLYRLVGRDVLEKELYPLAVMGRMAGESFTWEKSGWDREARKKLASFNFIDVSDAVMTRAAYDAAGGLQELSYLSDWQLWLDMIRAGCDRFRHVPHVGLRYTTDNLVHHRRYYAFSLFDKLNLTVDMAKLHEQAKGDITNRLKIKHGDSPHHISVQSPRPRVLLIGEAAAISHVARPHKLATHLHQQGYEVCFASDPRYNNLIPKNGLRRAEVFSLPNATVFQRLNRGEPIYDVATLDRYVQDELRLMREFKPDIVVGDQRNSLATSSRVAGVRYINIIDAHWSPADENEFEPVNSPLVPLAGLPIANLLLNITRPIALAYWTLPVNIIRVKYGLPPLTPNFKEVFTYGDYTVYPTYPELYALKHRLPRRHSFIGPLIWSPKVEKPEWWDRPSRSLPIVYVCVGSTGQPNLLESIFKILGDLPVTVIAATAARKSLEHVPANTFIADFLPGTEAARRSRLVICNGGTMSGQQTLSVGVPYLGLVSNPDQLLFSQAVQRVGACEVLRECEINESNLRQSIVSMLASERHQTAARACATHMAKWDSCREFEKVIGAAMTERI